MPPAVTRTAVTETGVWHLDGRVRKIRGHFVWGRK